MTVRLHQEGAGPINQFDTVQDAADWLLRFFEEHDWDAPIEERRRAGRDATSPEDLLGCRRLSAVYKPENYFIEDADGQQYRVRRDGEIAPEIQVPVSQAEVGEGESSAAPDGYRARTSAGVVVEGDSNGEVGRAPRRA